MKFQNAKIQAAYNEMMMNCDVLYFKSKEQNDKRDSFVYSIIKKHKDRKKYRHGKIYKLTSNQTDMFYIGSTSLSLKKRLSIHMSGYKRYLNDMNTYLTAYLVCSFNDCKIQLLENYPCANRKELEKREGYWQDQYPECCNKSKAGVDQLSDIKKYQEEYRQSNRDKINEKFTCDCGGFYTRVNRISHTKTKKHQTYLQNL